MAIDVSTIHLSFCDKIALTYIRIRKRVRIIDIDSHKHYRVLSKKFLIRNIPTEEGRPRPTEFYELHEIGRDYINYRSERRIDKAIMPIVTAVITALLTELLLHGTILSQLLTLWQNIANP